MISKSKHLRVLWRLGINLSMYRGDVDPIYGLLSHSFCDMILLRKNYDSINIAESPDLPAWVKFSEDGSVVENQDDDFVLPSMAYWVENQKLHDKKVDVKSMVGNVVDNDVEKISKIMNNRFETPDSVLQALNGCNVNVSDGVVDQILKRFNNEWLPAFGFFCWAKLGKGFKYSPNSYNLMVDLLGKSKKFDLMWEVVEEMHQLGDRYVTLVTMTKVMRRLAKACRYDEATEAFRKIERFGLSKDVALLNTLMDTLAKEQSVENAQDVYLEFKNHIPPNMHTFNILIRGWCKAKQFDKAQRCMEEMREHGLTPDVISYTNFIEGYCNLKDFRKVDAILEEMQEKGCPPNVVTYTIVMHALGKAKEINESLKVYEKMKQNGCEPDSSFYSSLIYVLSKAGRLKDARELFDDMPKQGVTPDVLTYNTMIATACQHSQEENALKLLKKMEESCCKPDHTTYVPLLKMCCRLKRMKVISFLLCHMLKNDVSVGIETYSILVRGLCKSEKLEHACAYFEELVMRGFVPWDNVYEMLIKELETKGRHKAKERIEELMFQASN